MSTLYKQDPKTGRVYMDVKPTSLDVEHLPMVQGDFKPIKMPDGTVITDRGKFREHCKAKGITPSSDYSDEFMKKRSKDREDRMYGRTKEQVRERRETIGKLLGEYGIGR